MKQQSATHIALLRGINVGGHNKILMPELRALCTKIGWKNVVTYIQSGNVVFTDGGPVPDLENKLENAIEKHFGLSIPVIIRRGEDWHTYVGGNPFPGAAAKEPNLVLMGLSRSSPAPGAVELLLERAAGGERIVQVGDVIWCHFGAGVAKSKLTPKFIDRVVGSPVTSRNWRTVQKLTQLLEQTD